MKLIAEFIAVALFIASVMTWSYAISGPINCTTVKTPWGTYETFCY